MRPLSPGALRSSLRQSMFREEMSRQWGSNPPSRDSRMNRSIFKTMNDDKQIEETMSYLEETLMRVVILGMENDRISSIKNETQRKLSLVITERDSLQDTLTRLQLQNQPYPSFAVSSPGPRDKETIDRLISENETYRNRINELQIEVRVLKRSQKETEDLKRANWMSQHLLKAKDAKIDEILEGQESEETKSHLREALLLAEKRIKILEKELGEERSKSENLIYALREAESRIEDSAMTERMLLSQVRELEREEEDVSRKNSKAFDARIMVLRQEVEETTRQNISLLQKLEHSQTEVSLMRTTIEEHKKCPDLRSELLSNFHTEQKRFVQEKLDLQRKLEELSSELATKEDALQNEVNKFTKERKVFKERSEEDSTGFFQAKESLKKEIEIVKNKNRLLEKELEEKIEEFSKEQELAIIAITRAKEEQKAIEKKWKESQIDSETQISVLKSQLSNLSEDQKISKLNFEEKIKELIDSKRSLKKSLDDTTEDHLSSIFKLERRIQDLGQSESSLRQELERLSNEHQNILSTYEEKVKKLTESEDSAKSAIKSITEESKAISSAYEEKIRTLTATNQKLLEEAVVAAEAHQKIKLQLERQIQEFSSSQVAVEEQMESELAKLKETEKNLNHKLAETSKIESSLKSEIGRMKVEKEELELLLQKKEQILEQNDSHWKSQISKLKEEHRKSEEVIKERLESLLNSESSTQVELTKITEVHRTVERRSEEKIKELISKIEEIKSNFSAQGEETNQAYKDLSIRLQEKEKMIVQLNTKLADQAKTMREEQSALLEQKISEIENLSARLSKVREELGHKLREKESELSITNSILEGRSSEVARLQEKVNELALTKIKISAMEKSLEEAREAHVSTAQQLDEQRVISRATEIELSKLLSGATEKMGSLEAKCLALQAELGAERSRFSSAVEESTILVREKLEQSFKSQLESVEQRLLLREEQIKKLELALQEKTAEIEWIKNEADQLARQNTDAKLRASSGLAEMLEEECARTRNALERLRIRERESADFRTALDSVQRDNAALISQIESLKTRLAFSSDEVSRLKDQLALARQEICEAKRSGAIQAQYVKEVTAARRRPQSGSEAPGDLLAARSRVERTQYLSNFAVQSVSQRSQLDQSHHSQNSSRNIGETQVSTSERRVRISLNSVDEAPRVRVTSQELSAMRPYLSKPGFELEGDKAIDFKSVLLIDVAFLKMELHRLRNAIERCRCPKNLLLNLNQ